MIKIYLERYYSPKDRESMVSWCQANNIDYYAAGTGAVRGLEDVFPETPWCFLVQEEATLFLLRWT